MQFKKLTNEQKGIKAWRRRRNALVAKLLAADPRLSSADALAQANRMMRTK